MSQTKPVIRRTLAESLLGCTAYQGQDSEPAAFGRAFHSWAASYVLLCKEAGEESRIGDVEQLATEAFWRAKGVNPSRQPEFLELCLQFASNHLADLATLVAVEETLTHDVGWALLTCTVDRIDRTDAGDPDDEAEEELLSDLKTEWTTEGDHTFQIWWYVQMRFLTSPALRAIDFRIDLVRRRWQPEVLRFERGQLDEWWASTQAALKEAWDVQQAGLAVPTGGASCTFCAKRYSCGAAIAAAKVLPENDDQAEEIFGELVRLEASVDEHKQALEAYFKDRAPKVWNGLEVGMLASRAPTPYTGDPAAVAAYLSGRGMEGAAVLKSSVDWAQIKTFWRELVDEGLAVLPERPVFKHRKAQLARKGKTPATTEEPSAPASPGRQSRHASAAEKGGSAHPVAGAGSSVATTTEPPSLMDLLDRSLEKAEREQKAKQEGRA